MSFELYEIVISILKALIMSFLVVYVKIFFEIALNWGAFLVFDYINRLVK